MGTTALVAVCGDAGLLVEAKERIEQLERRWTRFSPTSELSQLCDGAGGPTPVSFDTFSLIEAAVAGWTETGGRYDPTVRDAMIANGYERTFADLDDAPGGVGAKAPGCASIVLDPANLTVTLPAGVGLDPGGIGKGLAADMVAAELLASGARGALVDIGGDVRVIGEGPAEGGWVVDVADPYSDRPLLHLALTNCGIATSSCLRRRWGPEQSKHHIIDPSTGGPTRTAVAAAVVVADEAWRAEVCATAVIVAGSVDAVADLDAVAVAYDGSLQASGQLARLLA